MCVGRVPITFNREESGHGRLGLMVIPEKSSDLIYCFCFVLSVLLSSERQNRDCNIPCCQESRGSNLLLVADSAK